MRIPETPREIELELMLCQLIHHATKLIGTIEQANAVGDMGEARARVFEMQTNLRCKLDDAEELIG